MSRSEANLVPEAGPKAPGGPTASPEDSAWWPYVLPMFVFLIMTSLEGYLPHPARSDTAVSPWYPWFYSLKLALVIAALAIGRRALRDLLPWPDRTSLLLAGALGLLVFLAWIGLERLDYPRFGLTGSRLGFDPVTLPPSARIAFLAIRFLGLVAVVPLMEELFWRSFLVRLVIDVDFQRVPVGRVTPLSAGISSLFFAAAHPEWLPALFTGLVWAGLLARTRSLTACVVSHAVANLALGFYILSTRSWQLW